MKRIKINNEVGGVLVCLLCLFLMCISFSYTLGHLVPYSAVMGVVCAVIVSITVGHGFLSMFEKCKYQVK